MKLALAIPLMSFLLLGGCIHITRVKVDASDHFNIIGNQADMSAALCLEPEVLNAR